VKDFHGIDGDLTLAIVASGLLSVPLFGWLPMLAIGAAVAASIYIVNNTRPK